MTKKKAITILQKSKNNYGGKLIKEEARVFLKSQGWTPKKIAKFEV